MARKRPPKAKRQGEQAESFSGLLNVMCSLAAERDLDLLLQGIMHKASVLMDADRSTLYLVDEAKQQIWSKVAEGAALSEIRVLSSARTQALPTAHPKSVRAAGSLTRQFWP